MHTKDYNDQISDSRSKMSGFIPKKKGKVEDFMKVKAIRDQLNQKKQKIMDKISKYNDKMQTNMQRIQMMEFEVEQIKRDIASTKKEQVIHYQTLLKQGIDAR